MPKNNDYITDYLDYYCQLPHAPEFAVLLKGQWGSGKTWFIDKYREKLNEKNIKSLYISLYGISTISEIEDKFFQLLHPIMSSKGMAITGTIIKGLLKGALKIDLNNDGNSDGTWNIQVPEIHLPKHLNDINKSILIFDDLERANLDLDILLGYINYFVEHQKIKVILIANEDELSKKSHNYKSIKEKLIGKTLNIKTVFDEAAKDFIDTACSERIKEVLIKNTFLMKEIYNMAEYSNLRVLKQIVLDFQKIFESLPEKVKNKSLILQEILRFLVIFSIEIKRGLIFAKDISKVQAQYIIYSTKKFNSDTENEKEINSFQEMYSRYPLVNFYEPFPSALWWQVFFDQGSTNEEEMNKSISSSKYFQEENIQNWIKLWHYSNLSDDIFEILVEDIEEELNAEAVLEIGIIKHIFGLFLKFSDVGIYRKTKGETLEDAKKYINRLYESNQLKPLPESISLFDAYSIASDSYMNLGFQGKELSEFKEISEYIYESQKKKRIEKISESAEIILDAMQKDVDKFRRMICIDSLQGEDPYEPKYHENSILNYISQDRFIEKLLEMPYESQEHIFSSIVNRYKYENIRTSLIDELDWLQVVKKLLSEEISRRKGRLSGYLLQILLNSYLGEAIKALSLIEEPAKE